MVFHAVRDLRRMLRLERRRRVTSRREASRPSQSSQRGRRPRRQRREPALYGSPGGELRHHRDGHRPELQPRASLRPMRPPAARPSPSRAAASGQSVTFNHPGGDQLDRLPYSIPDTSGGSVLHGAPVAVHQRQPRGRFHPDQRLRLVLRQLPVHNTPAAATAPLLRRGAPAVHDSYPRAPRSSCRSSRDTASSSTIDFADFEQVGAALTQPGGSVSGHQRGADPQRRERLHQRRFNAASRRPALAATVWIPAGQLQHPRHIMSTTSRWPGGHVVLDRHRDRRLASTATPRPSPTQASTCRTFAIFGTSRSVTDSAQRSTASAAR